MLPADFNGDGKEDVVGVYDHGDGLVSMWKFLSDGTNFSAPTRAYDGCANCWEFSRSQMVPADVNGDGKDEVVGVYDYGNGFIRMWNFLSDGNKFSTVQQSYRGCSGCWQLSRSRMLAADVNGDGKDDIVGAYDYGTGIMGVWVFLSNGASFAPGQLWYRGCANCWELGRSEIVPADVNGDGKDDIVGVYDYGGGYIRMWNFVSDGASFSTVQQSYRGCSKCWYLSQSRMLAVDVDGDGKSDIVAPSGVIDQSVPYQVVRYTDPGWETEDVNLPGQK